MVQESRIEAGSTCNLNRLNVMDRGPNEGTLLDFTEDFKSAPKSKSRFLANRSHSNSPSKRLPHEQNKENAMNSNTYVPLEEPVVCDAMISPCSRATTPPPDPPSGMTSYATLNHQLDVLGFPLVTGDEASVVGVVETLLKELRTSQASVKNYESDNHRLTTDCRRMQGDKEALKLQVQCSNQDISALENKISIQVSKYKKEKSYNDEWTKELQVKISKLEGLQKQWQNSLNRKETEYERLQMRMQALQSQRERGLKRSIQISKPISPDETWVETTTDSLSQLSEQSLARKNEYLASENEKLHRALLLLQNTFSKSIEINPELKTRFDDLLLPSDTFEMGSCSLLEKLQDMAEKAQVIMEELSDATDSNPGQNESLAQSLEDAKLIIAEQSAMLQMSLCKTASPDPDTAFIFSEELIEERTELKELRNRLECDRRLILEEAQRLDSDRNRFEQEKFNFRSKSLDIETDQGASLSVYNIVSTPVTQKHKKQFDKDDDSRFPIPATPSTKKLLEEFM